MGYDWGYVIVRNNKFVDVDDIQEIPGYHDMSGDGYSRHNHVGLEEFGVHSHQRLTICQLKLKILNLSTRLFDDNDDDDDDISECIEICCKILRDMSSPGLRPSGLCQSEVLIHYQ
jgi:hypothetical protein